MSGGPEAPADKRVRQTHDIRHMALVDLAIYFMTKGFDLCEAVDLGNGLLDSADEMIGTPQEDR